MKATKNPHSKLFLGIGINYLLINIPFFVFCKYGYTGVDVGVKKRAKGIDRAMPGIPVPVFFVVTFFAYDIEQMFHSLASPLRANFYKGDGHTETYWILAALPALCLMVALWCFNIWLVCWAYKQLPL